MNDHQLFLIEDTIVVRIESWLLHSEGTSRVLREQSRELFVLSNRNTLIEQQHYWETIREAKQNETTNKSSNNNLALFRWVSFVFIIDNVTSKHPFVPSALSSCILIVHWTIIILFFSPFVHFLWMCFWCCFSFAIPKS